MKPAETADKLKGFANLEYGLKMVLVCSIIFLPALFLMSFLTDNLVYFYSMFTNLDRFSFDRAVSQYSAILQMFVWSVFIGLFIGLPVFIVSSLQISQGYCGL